MATVIRRRTAAPTAPTRAPLKPGDFVSGLGFERVPIFAIANPGKRNELICLRVPDPMRRDKLMFLRVCRSQISFSVIDNPPSPAGISPVPMLIRRRRR